MFRQTKQVCQNKDREREGKEEREQDQLEKAAALVMDSSLVPGLGLSRNTSVL